MQVFDVATLEEIAMRKILRETIEQVRASGGGNVSISEGGRHTRIDYELDGEQKQLILHRGNMVRKNFAGMIRSQIRRQANAS